MCVVVDPVISPDDIVKVTKMNHIIEVQHMEKMNRRANIKKLDKNHYLNISTGEIKEFEHISSRKESFNSLRQTFKKMRYLINNNFSGKKNELHIILTYAENMTDTKRLYKDFDKFMKRFKYHLKKDYNTTIDYISVVEPQGRGAWHIHLLARFNDLDKIFIPNSPNNSRFRAEIWQNGHVTIKGLDNIDNVGAYLSAYLIDMELTEENVSLFSQGSYEVAVKEIDGEQKRIVKGGRLHMYPPGLNIYRKSKGIVEPERQEMRFKDIKKIVGAGTPHYSKSFLVENEDFKNTITYLQYNTKRLAHVNDDVI